MILERAENIKCANKNPTKVCVMTFSFVQMSDMHNRL